MAWTTPPDFVQGGVPTEAQMDILSADLSYLLNYPQAYVVRDNGANYTTTSTTFVDVDASNLILTMSLSGGRAIVMATFHAFPPATGNGSEYDLIVDSTTRAGDATHGLARQPQSGSTQLITLLGYWSGLSIGSHTFKLQYRSITSGTTIISANGGAATIFAGQVVTLLGWGT